MIMLGFTRAIGASAIAFAIFPMTACDGHSMAENRGTAALVAGQAGGDLQSVRIDADTAPALEEGPERMKHAALVELHHFNVYKKFRAMLDAASDPSSDAACSGESLVKLGD